jgi:tRNA threonylcarbamoyladenosine biosynthesis protein TsaE
MFKELIIETSCLVETLRLAGLLGKLLELSFVVALEGDLGAGKTTLVKEIVRSSGNNALVTSPTFTLLNVYEGSPKFYHFDLYRLNSLEELEYIGGEELIPAKDGIVLIEWADRVPAILPERYLEIKLEYIDENSRKLRFIDHNSGVNLKKMEKQWLS